MNPNSQDDNNTNTSPTTNTTHNTCHCPLTNGDKCAVLANGWQPQELCHALKCEQLKLIDPDSCRRNEAA